MRDQFRDLSVYKDFFLELLKIKNDIEVFFQTHMGIPNPKNFTDILNKLTVLYETKPELFNSENLYFLEQLIRHDIEYRYHSYKGYKNFRSLDSFHFNYGYLYYDFYHFLKKCRNIFEKKDKIFHDTNYNKIIIRKKNKKIFSFKGIIFGMLDEINDIKFNIELSRIFEKIYSDKSVFYMRFANYKSDLIKNENMELKNEVMELKNKIIELEYAPGGELYREAENSFNELITNFN